MTERKVTALALVVFVTMATLSGGTSVSLLSDTEVVNTTVGVGNVGSGTNSGTQNVTDTSSRDGSGQDACTSGESSDVDDGDGGDEGLSIALDPASRTVDAGNETRYHVVVEGASENVTSYELAFEMCNPSVATFQNFTHSYDGVHDDNVTDDRIEIDSGVTGERIDGIPGPVVHLGTITVTGNASGQTAIRIVDESGWPYVTNGTASPYGIDATSDGTVTVTASKDPPSAENESYVTAENTTLTVQTPGVLGNDTGETLNASVVSGPEHGDLTLRSDGSFTYDPTPGFTGQDRFTYEVKDADGRTDTATVSISVG